MALIKKYFYIPFIVIIFSLTIFLLNPKYFINNYEDYIKNVIHLFIDGEIEFDNIKGNILLGFNISNISYKLEDKYNIYSKEVYIDPDLSNIIFGKISFSKIILKESTFKIDKNNDSNHASNFDITPFNIRALHFINSNILYDNRSYNLNGSLQLSVDNEIDIEYNNFSINGLNNKSQIILMSGFSVINKENINLKNIIIESENIKGKISGIVNIYDYEKSNLEIDLENFKNIYEDNSYQILGAYINNINKTDDISIEIKNIFFNEHKFDNINAKLKKNKKVINGNIKLSYLDNTINGEIIYNLEEYIYNLRLGFEKLVYGNNKILDADIDINNKQKNINILISSEKTFIDTFMFKKVKGNITINKNNIIGDLKFNNNDISGKALISNFKDIHNYNIDGILQFKDYHISQYNYDIPFQTISGQVDYSLNNNNNNLKLDADLHLNENKLFDFRFDNIYSSISLSYEDSEYKIFAKGNIKKWEFGNYDWESIDFSTNFENSKISDINIVAKSQYEDELKFKIESNKDNYFVSHFDGILKDNLFSFKPFYIKSLDDKYHFPNLKMRLNKGYLDISGDYYKNNIYNIIGNCKNINIDDIYNIIGKKLNINGKIVEGEFKIENMNHSKEYSPILLTKIKLESGSFDDIEYDLITLSSSYRNNRLLIDDLFIRTPLGSINGYGWCNINILNNKLFKNNDNFNLDFNFKNFDIEKINKYLPWEKNSYGLLNGSIGIYGNYENLNIKSNIEINKPAFDKIKGELFSGKINYTNKALYLKNLLLITKNGRYSGNGKIPLISNINNIKIEESPLDLIFTGTTKKLEFLSPYFNVVDSITAKSSNIANYALQLELTGNLLNPIRNGKIIINNGSIFFDPINEPIENIFGEISIIDNILIINSFEGNMNRITSENSISIPFINNLKNIFSKKKDELDKNIAITGTMDLSEFFRPKYAINIQAENIYMSSSYNQFYGRGDANLSIMGKDTIMVKGIYKPKPNDFIITNFSNEYKYTPDSYNTKTNYIYNIQIPFENGIKIQTDNMKLYLDGDITLNKYGNEDYNYSGKVNVIEGRYFDNQGNIFSDISGSIFLSTDKNASYMDIHAITELEPSTIDVSIIGNPENPELYFTDNTGQLSQTELLSMLTFGSADIQTENSQQFEKIITNYFENEIEKNIARTTPLDEFQFTSSGSLLSTLDNGVNSDDIDIKLILGKRLTNKMYLNTEIDITDFNENQYEAIYRLTRNTSIVGGMNTTEGNNSFHFKYRIKYYY